MPITRLKITVYKKVDKSSKFYLIQSQETIVSLYKPLDIRYILFNTIECN